MTILEQVQALHPASLIAGFFIGVLFSVGTLAALLRLISGGPVRKSNNPGVKNER